MSDDNTQDRAEPSPASVGSRPVLWALEWEEDAGRIDPEWVYDTHEEAVDVNETGCYGRATVVPLYRSPTLTDEEREAIEVAAKWCQEPIHPIHSKTSLDAMCAADTLRGILKRLT